MIFNTVFVVVESTLNGQHFRIWPCRPIPNSPLRKYELCLKRSTFLRALTSTAVQVRHGTFLSSAGAITCVNDDTFRQFWRTFNPIVFSFRLASIAPFLCESQQTKPKLFPIMWWSDFILNVCVCALPFTRLLVLFPLLCWIRFVKKIKNK